MMIDWKRIKVYIQPGATDMRKQINGLARIVQEETDFDLFSGALFLFCSRDRTRLKVVYWDKTGFCLWMKRLEEAKFPWPQNRAAVKEISLRQLRMLLSGVDFFHKHKELFYKEM